MLNSFLDDDPCDLWGKKRSLQAQEPLDLHPWVHKSGALTESSFTANTRNAEIAVDIRVHQLARIQLKNILQQVRKSKRALDRDRRHTGEPSEWRELKKKQPKAARLMRTLVPAVEIQSCVA